MLSAAVDRLEVDILFEGSDLFLHFEFFGLHRLVDLLDHLDLVGEDVHLLDEVLSGSARQSSLSLLRNGLLP